MLKEVKGMEKVYRVKTVHGYCYYVVTDNKGGAPTLKK